MRPRPIKTKQDAQQTPRLQIGGWLHGRLTYLWLGTPDNHCLGTISGQKLYRLAKAIVRQFETARKGGEKV